MGDTVQTLLWALGQRCTLRGGAAVTDPAAALQATRRARFFSDYREGLRDGFGVVDDVCVTVYTVEGDTEFPARGFLVSEALAPVGGVPGLHELCGACPANIHPERPVGCVGSFYMAPYAESTEATLEETVGRLGLEEDVRLLFPQTRPRYFGLWARSPLTPRGARVLAQMFAALYAQCRNGDEPGPQEFDELAQAATIAAGEGAKLHVPASAWWTRRLWLADCLAPLSLLQGDPEAWSPR